MEHREARESLGPALALLLLFAPTRADHNSLNANVSILKYHLRFEDVTNIIASLLTSMLF